MSAPDPAPVDVDDEDAAPDPDDADPQHADPDAAGVRVRAHPGLCQGWGNCHRFAPEVYPLDDDGFLDIHLLEVPPELARAARLGAAACPEQAITVIARSDPPIAAPSTSGVDDA